MNLILACILSLMLWPAQNTWPGFRGTGDSNSKARNLPLEWSDDKNIAWSTNLPGYGQSSPVVMGDRIFLTAARGAEKETLIVMSLDLKTGRRLWEKEFAATERMKDTNTVSKAAPTPVADSRRLYVFFESGDLMAMDHDGRIIWQRQLIKEYGPFKNNHGLGSSLAMTDRALLVLIAHNGPSFLLALDKQTGKNLWKTDRPAGSGWSTPLVASWRGQSQILVSAAGEVSAYDIETGRELWSVKGLKGNAIPSPSVADDLVVIGSSDRESNLAIRMGGSGDVTDSGVVWRAEEATAYFNSPLIHRGHVYFVNKVGVAFCLDLKTGEERWRARLEGECWASPLAVGDHIYFFANGGNTFVMRAGPKPVQLAKNTISDMERVYGVAAVDGALLLRSGRRFIRLSER